MKSPGLTLFAVALILLFVAGAGGLVWLSDAHIAPPLKSVTEVIPDDHIPR